MGDNSDSRSPLPEARVRRLVRNPVVLLSGGPGDSFVQNTARLMNVVMAGLRADRDLIIWDQRGTGFSEPVFCPELNARWREIGAPGLERSARVSERRQALADCRETMLRQGVDLSQYNTVAESGAAHDWARRDVAHRHDGYPPP